MLKLDAIDSFYGESHVLHGISLEMPQEARVSVLGRNGAGKSTLLKSVLDAEPMVVGLVEWNGENMSRLDTADRVRAGICLVPEDRRIFPHLTALENIEISIRGLGRKPSAPFLRETLERFPMLVLLASQAGGTLSGGQQQMLAIARALATAPKLLLLDEPTEGLAPVIVQQLATAVSDACRTAGMGLLLCEQNIWFARQCTDFVYLLDSGSLVFGGRWDEFDARPELKQRHLAI